MVTRARTLFMIATIFLVSDSYSVTRKIVFVKTVGRSLIKHKYKTGAALALTCCAGLYGMHRKRQTARNKIVAQIVERARTLEARYDALFKRAKALPESMPLRVRGEQELMATMSEARQLFQLGFNLEDYSLKHILRCINKDTVTERRSVTFSTFLQVGENYLAGLEGLLSKMQEVHDFADIHIKGAADLKAIQEARKADEEKVMLLDRELKKLVEQGKELDGRWHAWAKSVCTDLAEVFNKNLRAKIEKARAFRQVSLVAVLDKIDQEHIAVLNDRHSINSYLCRLCILMARESHIFRE
jgi:hypothetical protein